LNNPSKELIQEWAEGPVNAYLIKLIEKYCLFLDESRGINAYCPGDPEKTQETLARLNGEYFAWGEAIEVLKGELSIVMEEEDE